MSIQIVVQFELRPETAEHARAAFRTLAEQTRAEPGVRRFDAFTTHDQPHRVLLVEEWDNQHAIDEHMTHEHTAVFRAATEGAFQTEPVVNRLAAL